MNEFFPTVIPYHFTLSTGVDRDASTTARAYIIIIGPNDVETDRLWLDLPESKKGFVTGTMDHFVCYAADVGEIKRVEVRIWDCLSGSEVVSFPLPPHMP